MHVLQCVLRVEAWYKVQLCVSSMDAAAATIRKDGQFARMCCLAGHGNASCADVAPQRVEVVVEMQVRKETQVKVRMATFTPRPTGADHCHRRQ